MPTRSSLRSLFLLSLVLISGGTVAADAPATFVLKTTDLNPISERISDLSSQRVIFLGEQHNRYADQLNHVERAP